MCAMFPKVGQETLRDQFTQLLESYKKKKDHDDIFDAMKSSVKDESMARHQWDQKAEDSLVS